MFSQPRGLWANLALAGLFKHPLSHVCSGRCCVGAAAMLAHQPLYKRRADVLILDERADALGFVIGEGGVLLAECRANLIKTKHVFFAFVGVEERADPIAVFKESIRELESWPRVMKTVALHYIRDDSLGSLVE